MKEVNSLERMDEAEFIGCDIFCGAGGMSLGAELAGIMVKLAVENDEHAAQTFKINHPNAKLIEDDIRNVMPKKYMNEAPFVLFGGPPCQGFSLSNTLTRNSSNTNNSLFEEYIRFVKELNPKWCVFENVEGFRSFQNGNTVKEVTQKLNKLGYQVKSTVLRASDYGVPQDRNRFFLVGNRIGLEFEFPKALKEKVTVEDAINDLPSLENGTQKLELPYRKRATNAFAKMMRNGSKSSTQNLVSKNQDYVIDRYRYIKPGQNWKAIPDHLMKNYKDKSKCHSGIYKRLDPNRPSVVISNYRKNMLIHPYEDRGLSVREAARIQSFPDNFEFKGTLMYMQQQIGNAVPPLLAKAIFEQIILVSRNVKATK